MKKQYISSSNEAPKLPPLSEIAFWFMYIKYFNLPEWSLGVLGLLVAISVIGFFVRIPTEKQVAVVKR